MFLRKQGRYWHVIYFTDLGERKSFTTKRENKSSATNILKDFEAKKRLGLQTGQEAGKKLFFSVASNLFLDTKKEGSTTRSCYECAIIKFLKTEPDKKISAYHKSDFVSFIRNMEEDCSIATITNYLKRLRIIFNYFVAKRMIHDNPVPETKEIKDILPNAKFFREPEPMQEWKMNLILRDLFLRGRFKQYDTVMLTFLCALRVSEALFFEVEDFDFKNKSIFVRNSKGKRVDQIPMLKDTEEFLLQMDLPASGRLFNYASRDGAKTFWNTTLRKVGIDATKKSLRSARGSQLANAGVPPLFLQKYMRHKNIQTTLRYYVHLETSIMRESIDKKLAQKLAQFSTSVDLNSPDFVYNSLSNIDI